MANMKRGDLAFAFDPVRGTGTGSGFRGLCLVDDVGPDEVKVRPLTEIHNYVRLPMSAIHLVFSAAYVAEGLLK